MSTIGFLISTKENEKRRALLPEHVAGLGEARYHLFFETGYGDVLGHSDEEYRSVGANVVSREETMKQDVICDPKIGDADYLSELNEGQSIWGWVHAVQNRETTGCLVDRKMTAIAWEDMFEQERHVFWRNNELAGEAAVLHAFTLYGKLPNQCKVAMIGNGNVGKGAFRVLSALGANVMVYSERLEGLLQKELPTFDVIVNCITWDLNRKDHIIYRDDLVRMKKNSMIIDVSCDLAGGIESSVPTTIEDPVYTVNGVLHYVVDHTPSIISYTATKAVGDELVKYIDFIVDGEVEACDVLEQAIIIKNGNVIDKRIIDFQKL